MRFLFIFLLTMSLMSGGSAFAIPTLETTYGHVVSYAVVTDMKVHVVLSDMTYAENIGCSTAYYLIGDTSNNDQSLQIHWFEEQIRMIADAMTNNKVVIATFTNEGPCSSPHHATEIDYLTRTNVAALPVVGGSGFTAPSIMYYGQVGTEWHGYSDGAIEAGQNYRFVNGILEAPQTWCEDANNGDPAYVCPHGCPVN